MSPIIVEKREDLLARREEILSSLGLSLGAFHNLEETRTLTGEEFEARE